MEDDLKKAALNYHRYPRPGKIEVVPTKPYDTPEDLALAYSPGVAYPCLEIKDDAKKIFDYTNKGNLVAVISNGTAVLGLGDIGAKAAKPVMEGKALLFKIFAGLDSFDIEIDEKDPKEFIKTVARLAPTFGGINLEDIKAPECFEIETTLRDQLDIPVMHDDQHGTAIISSAALLNALKLQDKKIEDARLVVNGAGAAAIACTRLFCELGMRHENIVMCDSKGVIRADRENLNASKKEFATTRDLHTLAEAMVGADVFLGLSVADVVTPEMVLSMAPRPIVFALANPAPEIAYDLAIKTRPDIIFATGRSDYPNQINNVLGFPYIFRGALDCGATTINEEMKVAAARAIASLAQEPVPDTIVKAYGGKSIEFGPDYILPKPFDRRLLTVVAPAVIQAAMDSGVARKRITDFDAYRETLEEILCNNDSLIMYLMTAHDSCRVPEL
ncbi:MAG: malate dehydrogenase [Muribaculaceae bacterium]|nr:malate dehydrogenase [Muribaculaceae bacterium]